MYSFSQSSPGVGDWWPNEPFETDYLIFDRESLPLLLRAALAVPADLVHLAEELKAVAFGIVEVEGVVVAGPFVLDLAADVHALREKVF